MPLPTPDMQRRNIHTRTITCRGYATETDGWRISAVLTDTRKQHMPGELNDMSIDMSCDAQFTIRAIGVQIAQASSMGCARLAANFQRLVGATLAKGFRRQVRERLGEDEGCALLVDLLGPLATTAFQTANRVRTLRRAAQSGDGTPPPFLNTCHAWADNSPVVKREFPALYTGD